MVFGNGQRDLVDVTSNRSTVGDLGILPIVLPRLLGYVEVWAPSLPNLPTVPLPSALYVIGEATLVPVPTASKLQAQRVQQQQRQIQ